MNITLLRARLSQAPIFLVGQNLILRQSQSNVVLTFELFVVSKQSSLN